MAALLSTQSRAETYVCDIDIDTEIDGIAPSGSAINDGSINYTATPCDEGVCFRTIDDGTGTNTIVEMSTDLGATFTNITSDLETLDSSLIGGILESSSYNPDTDQLLMTNFSDYSYWIVDDASDVAMMSVTELSGTGSGNGSIDRSTGEFIGSYYVDSTMRTDIYSFSSGSSPTEIYSRTGYDSSPVADLNNDRIYMIDSSYNGYGE